MFKLDYYCQNITSQVSYIMYQLDMLEIDKINFFHEMGISYDTFRTSKSYNVFRKHSINMIYKSLSINTLDVSNINKYENCINNLYLATYRKELKQVLYYVDLLDSFINENTFLTPVFLLFKVFGLIYCVDDMKLTIKSLKMDIEYLKSFSKRNYFKDNMEMLFLSILYIAEFKIRLEKYKELAEIYQDLKWIYLTTLSRVSYLKNKDKECLDYNIQLYNEHLKNNNNVRAIMAECNIMLLYNISEQYNMSLSLSNNYKYFFYSREKYENYDSILQHNLFSNYMLENYEIVVKYYTSKLFIIEKLNWVMANICILSAYHLNKIYLAQDIIEYFKDNDNVKYLVMYLNNEDDKLLENIKSIDYMSIIFVKLKKLKSKKRRKKV